jgi:uncharacterized integral membrane protein
MKRMRLQGAAIVTLLLHVACASNQAAVTPQTVSSDRPGHEIEHPLAVVILGGLVTSTILNLFLCRRCICAMDGVKRFAQGRRSRCTLTPTSGPPALVASPAPGNAIPRQMQLP